jgi:hypothetical protein
MIGAAPKAEQWDFIWNYTDGNPFDNGFTKLSTGSAGIDTLVTGYRLWSGTNSYIFLRKDDYRLPALTLEASFSIINAASGDRIQNTRISAGTGVGEAGLGIYICNGYWRIMDTAGPAEGTKIIPFTSGAHIVRLTIKNGYGDAWIDGDKVVTSFPLSNARYSATTFVGQQNGGACIVTSIKLRAGA